MRTDLVTIVFICPQKNGYVDCYCYVYSGVGPVHHRAPYPLQERLAHHLDLPPLECFDSSLGFKVWGSCMLIWKLSCPSKST